MRLTTLLLLRVAVLLLTAPAASFAQTSKPVQTADLFTPDSAAIIHPNAAPSTFDRSSSLSKFDTMNSQSVCFTMRTYVMARNSPDSDATHPAGYYECLPSWKLEMRTSKQDRGNR